MYAERAVSMKGNYAPGRARAGRPLMTGASRGIGRRAAERLAKRGTNSRPPARSADDLTTA